MLSAQPVLLLSAANILVRYLGEEGEKTPIRAAISMCNPFNLVRHCAACSYPRWSHHRQWHTCTTLSYLPGNGQAPEDPKAASMTMPLHLR